MVRTLSLIIMLLLFITQVASANEDISFAIAQSNIRTILDGTYSYDHLKEMKFSDDGSKLFVAQSKRIKIFDVSTGEIIKTISWQNGYDWGDLSHFAVSPNSSHLAIAGMLSDINVYAHTKEERALSQRIPIFDTETGQMILTLNSPGMNVQELEFSHDGKFIALASMFENDNLTVWNLKEEAPQLSRLEGHKDTVHDVSFSPINNQLASVGGGQLIIWNYQNRRWVKYKELSGFEGSPTSVAYSNDSKNILIGDNSNVIKMISTTSFEVVGRIEFMNEDDYNVIINDTDKSLIDVGVKSVDHIQEITFSKDGKTVCVVGSGTYPIPFYKVLSFPSLKTISYQPNGQHVAISPDSKLIAYENNDILMLKNSTNGSEVSLQKQLINNAREISFSNDSNVFKLEYENKHTLYLNLETLQFYQQDENHGWYGPQTEVSGYEISSGSTDGSFFDNLLKISKGGREISRIINAKNGYHIGTYSFSPDGKKIVVGGARGPLRIYSRSGRKLYDLMGASNFTVRLAFSPNGKWLAAANVQGIVNFYNAIDFKADGLFPAFSAYVDSNNEWVIWNNLGFYDSSKKGAKLIGWHVNKGFNSKAEYYPLDQFSRYLRQRKVVQDTVNYASASKATKENFPEGVLSPADLIDRAPPVITASHDNEGNGFSHIYISLKDLGNSSYPADHIYVFSNGALILSQEINGNNSIEELAVTVPLIFGSNDIDVFLQNKWSRSGMKLKIDSSYRSKKIKKQLYVAAIATDKYSDARLDNLDAPITDAQKILKKFSELNGALYENINIKTFYNFSSKNNDGVELSDRLAEFFSKANYQDVSIIYLAGHGVTDSGGNYQYLYSDSEISVTNTGVVVSNSFDWNRLYDILNSTLGKRIVILDTCQAGDVIKKSNPYKMKIEKELSETMTAIFSASTSNTAAYESPNGGIFTNALLATIDNKANYKRGVLTISMLSNQMSNKDSISSVDVNFKKKGISLRKISNEVGVYYFEIPELLKEMPFFLIKNP